MVHNVGESLDLKVYEALRNLLQKLQQGYSVSFSLMDKR